MKDAKILFVIVFAAIAGVVAWRLLRQDVAVHELSLARADNTDHVPTLAELRGKVVLLEFWEAKAGQSHQAISGLIDLHEKHSPEGLVIIAVTTEPKTEVDTVVDAMKIPYIIGYDDAGRTSRAYNVTRKPWAFLIGRDGTVRWHGHPGFVPHDKIKAVLAETCPAAVADE